MNRNCDSCQHRFRPIDGTECEPCLSTINHIHFIPKMANIPNADGAKTIATEIVAPLTPRERRRCKRGCEGGRRQGRRLAAVVLPMEALLEIAKVMEFGAKKYSLNNWRNGFKWRRVSVLAVAPRLCVGRRAKTRTRRRGCHT
jgi:hypothetical protein